MSKKEKRKLERKKCEETSWGCQRKKERKKEREKEKETKESETSREYQRKKKRRDGSGKKKDKYRILRKERKTFKNWKDRKWSCIQWKRNLIDQTIGLTEQQRK